MADIWGFEEKKDGLEGAQGDANSWRKIPKPKPLSGTIRDYTNNLGNTLERSAGGDGGALPPVVQPDHTGRKEGMLGNSAFSDPTPDVAPAVRVPETPKQGSEPDNSKKYTGLFPSGPVGGIDKGIVRPVENTSNDDRFIILPDTNSRDDGIIITPEALDRDYVEIDRQSRSGNSVANRMPEKTGTVDNENRQSQPAGAGIGEEGANLPNRGTFSLSGMNEWFSDTNPNDSGKTIDLNEADPAYWLARAESENYKKNVEKALNPFYRSASDMAQGLADARHATFDPEMVTRYSREERELMQHLMNAHINVSNSTFDADMAKKQAYPFLNRIHDGTVAASGSDLSGIKDGTFSLDTLNEQVKNHLYQGTAPDLRLSRTVAQTMNSLDNTPYGKMTKNFMAGVHMGMVNLTQNSIQTAVGILSSAPPPETAMLYYQQMYIAHGDDTAGLAHELEQMNGFIAQVNQNVSDQANRVKDIYRGIRSDDYNQLEWLTLDRDKAAYARPDKMAGDFFEKLLPAMLSMKGVSKLGEGINLTQKGVTFIKGVYAVDTGYKNAYMDTKRNLAMNPQLIDNDPEYLRYRQESNVPANRGREIYAEAKARQNGLQAAMLTLATSRGQACSGRRQGYRQTVPW